MADPAQSAVEHVPRCPCCDAPGEPLYSGINDRVFGTPGAWDIAQCGDARCRLLWLNPRFTRDQIHQAYASYYTHTGPAEPPANPGLLKRCYYTLREACWHRAFGYGSPGFPGLHHLARLHPGGADTFAADVMFLPKPASGARLLDVGCGHGWLLRRMKKLGWDAQGVEFDPKCVELVQSHGVPCRLGDLREQNYPANHFDAIHAAHVIEHVFDPITWLAECHRILKPGGRLVLLTPNADGWGRKKYGADWRGLEVPRHLQIFDANNLRTTLQKAGLSAAHLRTTNRGAFYIIGLSAAIRAARIADQPRLGTTPGIFSPRGIWLQLLGRSRLWPDRLAGEELLAIATK